MKKTCVIATLAVCAGMGALADDTTGGNAATGPQPKNLNSLDQSMNDMTGKLGVGITLGDPIGGSAKYFINNTLAVDGALGWSPADHSGVAMHGDLLWHDYNLIRVPQGRLPVYVGVGGLFRERGHNEGNQAGIRVPVGVSYLFANMPLDIFAEVGPALDMAPFVRGEITGGVGVRYWF